MLNCFQHRFVHTLHNSAQGHTGYAQLSTGLCMLCTFERSVAYALHSSAQHRVIYGLQVYKGKDGNSARAAVAGLSLAIHRHECFGLLGPNGAGKTTTVKVRSLLSILSLLQEQDCSSIKLSPVLWASMPCTENGVVAVLQLVKSAWHAPHV